MPRRTPVRGRKKATQIGAKMKASPMIVCTWCGATICGGDAALPAGHGICDRCAATPDSVSIDDLARVTPDRLECLPFGIIRLHGDGEIIDYTSRESRISGRRPEEVIGSHFFRDVAPCARVRDFHGRFVALRSSGRNGREEFHFVFRFPEHAVAVKVAIAYDAATDVTTLLIRPLG